MSKKYGHQLGLSKTKKNRHQLHKEVQTPTPPMTKKYRHNLGLPKTKKYRHK